MKRKGETKSDIDGKDEEGRERSMVRRERGRM